MSIQFILGALFGMLLTACIAIAIEVSRVMMMMSDKYINVSVFQRRKVLGFERL